VPNVASTTIAAIMDNRITPLFIAAIRVLIEQGGCIGAAFLSRERHFRNGHSRLGRTTASSSYVRYAAERGSQFQH